MKPISTLMSPLRTVDLKTGGPAQAQSERSDVTAVPAMGVIAETMMALVLAQRCSRSSAATRLSETKRNFEGMWTGAGAHAAGGGLVKGTSCYRPAGVGEEHRGPLVAEQPARRFVDIDAIVERARGGRSP